MQPCPGELDFASAAHDRPNQISPLSRIPGRAKLLLKRRLLFSAYSVAQMLRERLQEPPSDGSVSFDQRTEFPQTSSGAPIRQKRKPAAET
jgi:hypothetical protein